MGGDDPDHLDAHARPPPEIREIYKRYQRAKAEDVSNEPDLIDATKPNFEENTARVHSLTSPLPVEIEDVIQKFLYGNSPTKKPPASPTPRLVFEIQDMPGLYIYPGLFAIELQQKLLDLLLHRDLSNDIHQTNVHMHYNVSYPPVRHGSDQVLSFFDENVADTVHLPRDPEVHKPIKQDHFLNKKLRWITLGGQYDWTKKVYPSSEPPEFPSDIKRLVEGIFLMKAEAAIVNLYSPGDTLSLHRDVSEDCNRPLVSVSIGCDAVFTVGIGCAGNVRTATIRIRSGDAVLMSGESRYAWHGVPKILPNTCPTELQDWPGHSNSTLNNSFERWRGWMSTKRINLNVRQMFA